MKNDIAIKVENISKRYEIGESSSFVTLRDKLIDLPRRIFQGPKNTKKFWALKDVSFEIKKGEVVGIIGRNGAGKSTLLKILARITEPTEGKVTMYGRVASMLEVGTGFNPELTGRENIYLNGAIIGMKKKEIASKFNDIVEFSGIGKFLDTPVKHYSSGMYVRLAFAVAAHLDADILLVDEVLAVGDSEFQKKCLGKMSDLASSGRTVIFVSHSLSSVAELCSKAIFMENSRLLKFDKVKLILNQYMSSHLKVNPGKADLSSNLLRRGSSLDSIFQFKKISILNSMGETSSKIFLREPFSIIVEGIAKKKIKFLKIAMSMNTQFGYPMFNTFAPENLCKEIHGRVKFQIDFDNNLIAPGTYSLGLGANGDGITDWIPEAISMQIENKDNRGNINDPEYDGVVLYPCKWSGN